MQYDNPLLSGEVTDALNGNPSLSSNTVAAISQILGLDTAQSVVVGSWDGSGDVTLPSGQAASAIFADVPGAAGDDVVVDLTNPDVSGAKAFVFASDANLTLDFTATSGITTFAADTAERVIVSGNGNDTITVDGGNTTVDAGNGNDTVTVGSGNDVVIANSGNNSISTGAGNDTIIAGTGNDTIDAGTGYDVVQAAGARGDVTVTGDVVAVTTATGSLTTTNAEFISFDNGQSLSIATTDDQAAALRLFEGLLGRDADVTGAQGWSEAADAGTSTSDIANAFLHSTEYQNALNDDFVASVYSTLLGRDADSEGEATWLSLLANGTSRTDVINAIAGSTEGQSANVSDTDYVKALYTSALGRDADETGLATWTAQLEAGADRSSVAANIAGSSEASAKSISDYIDSLYTNALGRAADTEGKANWTAALEHGATQADVAIGIVGSEEGVAHNTSVVVVQHGVA